MKESAGYNVRSLEELIFTCKANKHDFDYPNVAKIFSEKVLLDVHDNFFAEREKVIMVTESASSFSVVLNKLYRKLLLNYRCEYVYKNEIINQLVLTRKETNRLAVYTEFRVGKSIGDVVVFDETSTVYEIKTELDNFNRIDLQVAEYRKFFDKIYFVTHHSITKKLVTQIDPDIGIFELNSKGKLILVREADSNVSNINSSELFTMLHKSEYLKAIEKFFGVIPNVNDFLIYQTCRSLFSNVRNVDAHTYVVEAIKARAGCDGYFALKSAPKSLKVFEVERRLKSFEVKSIANLLAYSLPINQ